MTLEARDGLLWLDGRLVPLPDADALARKHGLAYAEQLVARLASGRGPCGHALAANGHCPDCGFNYDEPPEVGV